MIKFNEKVAAVGGRLQNIDEDKTSGGRSLRSDPVDFEYWAAWAAFDRGCDKNSTYGRLMEGLAKRAEAYFAEKGITDGIRIEADLSDAREIVDDLQRALKQDTEKWNEEGADPRRAAGAVWRHHDPEVAFAMGTKHFEAVAIDRGGVIAAATEFLKHPWYRSTWIEWAIVESLISNEVVQVGDQIKFYAPGPKEYLGHNSAYVQSDGNWRAIQSAMLQQKFYQFCTIWLGIPAASAGAFYIGWAKVGLAIAAVFVLMIAYKIIRLGGHWLKFAFVILGHKFGVVAAAGAHALEALSLTIEDKFQQNLALHKRMIRVSKLVGASEGLKNPSQIIEALKETEKYGASWPSAIYSMLGRIRDRDAHVWIIEY